MKNIPAHSDDATAPQSPARPVGRRRLLAWLPVILWLAVIFTFSTDAGSSRRTSRIIGPLLRWFHSGVSQETIDAVQAVVRKGAHLAEYAILAVLIWRALRGSRRDLPHQWSTREAVAAVALTALCAITDEWHQAKVPSRQGQLSDVIIDTAGAAIGVTALWWAGRARKRW